MKNKDKIFEKIAEELPGLRKNEPMAKHTTFHIGGPAAFYYEAKRIDDLVAAIVMARKEELPYFVLGKGSNVLFSDAGYGGLVIKNESMKIEIKGSTLFVESGVSLAEIIKKSAESGLSGLEFAAGIPGSVGGAIYGNAGAWQKTIGEKVNRVLVLDSAGTREWLSRSECNFGYRQSRFKKTGEIILSAEFILTAGEPATITQLMEENLDKRKGQPREPSAGSIFVNPKPDSAGRLIEAVGLKGKKLGGAMISSAHANFIINTGGARAEDVIGLIKIAKEKVRNEFEVSLEEEICLIGFDQIKR